MDNVVDFSKCQKLNKLYAGANGSKICIKYNGFSYMLKFPAYAKLNKEMSYANSCFSEYLGCKIFNSVGVPVQETILGTYSINGKEKIVVACGDFTRPGLVLQDFASLKNQIIDSERMGYGTELDEIIQTINEQSIIDPSLLLERFWDMFIIDALIGNWDRHNGNWGFLYNTVTDRLELAPVYDCGSSLYPQADNSIMHSVITNENELKARVYEVPTSAIVVNKKRINYFNFISSLKNEECNKALVRIVPRINMTAINEIIDSMPFITELQRNFYKITIAARKELILDYSLKKMNSTKQVDNSLSNLLLF